MTFVRDGRGIGNVPGPEAIKAARGAELRVACVSSQDTTMNSKLAEARQFAPLAYCLPRSIYPQPSPKTLE